MEEELVESDGQWDAKGVVEEGPEEILVDILHNRPGQADGRRHVRQPTLYENHIRRINCHVRSGSDGNARIGPGQGRGVVDPVPDHGDLALFLQVPDDFFLSCGQNASDDPVYPGRPANGPCCIGIISGQHDNLDAKRLQLPDSFRALLLHGVGHGDDAQVPAVLQENQGRLAVIAQLMSEVHGVSREFCDTCRIF